MLQLVQTSRDRHELQYALIKIVIVIATTWGSTVYLYLVPTGFWPFTHPALKRLEAAVIPDFQIVLDLFSIYIKETLTNEWHVWYLLKTKYFFFNLIAILFFCNTSSVLSV